MESWYFHLPWICLISRLKSFDPVQKRTFLLDIGVDICKQPNPDPAEYKAAGHERKAPYLLNEVQDKVVQDADDTEGTGTW
jgi:6-phosphogluconate dehydrogenase